MQNVLAQAFEKKGVSISAFCKEIQIAEGTFCRMRNGERPITPWVAVQCADILGRPWPEVLAEVMAEQGRSEGERKLWRSKISGKARAAAVVSALFLGMSFTSMESHAAPELTTPAPSIHSAQSYVWIYTAIPGAFLKSTP